MFVQINGLYINHYIVSFNPIQDGGEGGKKAPYQFYPLTFTNMEISAQNFLTFSFNTFVTLM